MIKDGSIPIHSPARSSNRLLAVLPASDYERLAVAIETVPLKLKATIHKPDEAISHVYFPGGGFCSVLTVLKDGRMVEVVTIGREGMVGLPVILDAHNTSPSLTMVQGETDVCYRIPTEVFRREM